MNIVDIINKKRLKQNLSESEINYFIENMMNGNIKDYQISSLLMAITLNGMNLDETINLTDAMIRSGEVIDLSNILKPTIDKHSTGGVGDKVTLVLAPLLASLDFSVAKMSGRGLGHTGGTIDKLEAISGYQVEINKEDFIKQVNEHNIAVISQTGNLAPADKKLYALRDVTGTVESIPLIAASIMSKKIASGSKFIILDVKVGNGALMKTLEDAEKLANMMIEIGKRYDRKVVCALTNMEEPLGYAIGNSLEVIEAIDALNGKGPKDLIEIVLNLAAISLMHRDDISLEDAYKKSYQNILNGNALEKFKDLIRLQHGDISSLEVSKNVLEIKSLKSGYIKSIKALNLGELARNLGAGRISKEDIINPKVGIVLTKKVSEYVNEGDTLMKIYYEKESDVLNIQNNVSNYFEIVDEDVLPPKLIYKIIK